MSLYVKIPLVYFERDIIMSQWDKDYLGLCRKILEEGTEVVNRTGTNTIKVPSHHFHFDLSQEFPILTTKQLFIRQAVLEMMWIYQAQSNDVRWLQERDVKIWNEWEIDEKGYWNATQMLPDENGNLVKTEVHKFFGKERCFRAVYGQANGMLPTESLTAGYISVLVMFRLVYHLMLRNMQHFFVCLHRFAV